VRLNKYLSESGACSRREADNLIGEGRVTVNGKRAQVGMQIRRMCEALGYTVEALQRVRIMHIKLGELPLGRWRQLSAQEIAPLLPASAAEPAREPRRTAVPRSRRFGR
jgi:16S rRNA U516 pseudouridylate synthase RsuA-like enzyme